MTPQNSTGPLVLGVLLGCLALIIPACGGGSGSTLPAEDEGSPPAPFGLTNRATLAELAFPAAAPSVGTVDLVRAFPMLSFSRPVMVRGAGVGSHWLYVVEQNGRILVLDGRDENATTTSTLLDIRSSQGGAVSRASNEEGLLGLCFAPNFTTSGLFYVHYSAAGPRRSIISEFQANVSADPDVAPTLVSNSERVLLTVPQPYSNHNAGMLEFGPDGYLYVAFGDGGSGNDPDQNGQDLGTILGSMIRIDPFNPSGGREYGIPADNPYVDDPNALDEIWAHGLRNPWRFSFDRNTGELLLGDVGQVAREEIDLIRRGGNYGWRRYEGNRSNLNPGDLPANLFDAPIIDYPRGLGTTVVGGYVYRGQDVPSLQGIYVYGDYGSGTIWGLTHTDGVLDENAQIASLGSLVSFGEDDDGEVYAVSLNGTLHRFQEPVGTPPPDFPDTLSETGLFEDLATLTPASGVIPYDVNSPLYSDDAFKQRWIALPNGTTIDFEATGAWNFPVGTVLVKHFEIELTVGDPNSRRRLETRVLLKDQAGNWSGYTYRWNQAQTDADLLPGAFEETFTISDPLAAGGMREQTWSYPSRTACLQCHTEAAGRVLGVRTEQLRRDFDYGQVVDDQLRSWNHIGLFDIDIGDHATYAAWPDPSDGTLALPARARAYLAANCAHCHQPGAPAPGNVDLRYSTPIGQTGTLDVAPLQGDLGLPAPRIIDPGDRENSVLWLRMQTTDTTRMPRIGSNRPHGDALDWIGAWIDAGAD